MNLKQLREERNLTMGQLSEMAGIPKRTLEDIQRRGDCLVSNAIKLACALGVSMDELCITETTEATEAN